MQTVCNECRGSGQVISEKDKCPQCHGQKVVQEKKVLEVHIDKGMVNNQKIVFQGEADEAPGTIPGDIVFVVQEKEHPTFKRKGPDLFLEKDISLVEALCGFQMTVTHLDKRQLVISTNEGDVVKPGSFKAVYDEGMPTYQQPFNKGKLFIHFNVKFPEPGDLSDDDMKALEKIFPARIPVEIDPGAGGGNMHDVDIEQEMRRNKSSGRTAYEEDDDDDMGGRKAGAVRAAVRRRRRRGSKRRRAKKVDGRGDDMFPVPLSKCPSISLSLAARGLVHGLGGEPPPRGRLARRICQTHAHHDDARDPRLVTGAYPRARSRSASRRLHHLEVVGVFVGEHDLS